MDQTYLNCLRSGIEGPVVPVLYYVVLQKKFMQATELYILVYIRGQSAFEVVGMEMYVEVSATETFFLDALFKLSATLRRNPRFETFSQKVISPNDFAVTDISQWHVVSEKVGMLFESMRPESPVLRAIRNQCRVAGDIVSETFYNQNYEEKCFILTSVFFQLEHVSREASPSLQYYVWFKLILMGLICEKSGDPLEECVQKIKNLRI